MFDRYRSYKLIHGAAHKRGAPAIGSPSLTRQLTLTCEHESYAAENDPKDPEHHTRTKKHYNFLKWQERNLKKAFWQLAEDLRIPEAEIAQSNTLYQHFMVDGLLVKTLLELYKDHLKFLIIVELEPPEDTENYQHLDLSSDGASDAPPTTGLRSKLVQCFNAITEIDVTDEALLDVRQFVRNDFWTQLDEILCIDDIEGLSDSKFLLDLRGCILAADDITAPSVHEPSQSDATTVPQVNGQSTHDLTKILWRFSSLGKNYEHREFVCCSLFRGTCMYMSSIGSHIAPGTKSKLDEDATFFTATAPRGSRWQVGRLLYRVNEVASFRLMALKNMVEILTAGTTMSRLGILIERLSDVDFEDDETKKKLKKLQNYKAQIDGLGITNSAELGYKIERSRYFVRRFDQAVGTIDVGRVEGWQPYSDFVERRLRPTFEKISDISVRFDTLLRLYHAQLAELDSELQRQSSDHLVEIQYELLDSSSFQHKIESIALAYYGGSIVFAWLFGLVVLDPEFFGIAKEYKGDAEKWLKGLVFLGTSAFALAYYLHQEKKHHKKSKDRSEKLRELTGISK